MENETDIIKIYSIKSNFHKPIRVGEEVSLSLINKDNKHLKIDLINGESIVTSIEIKWDRSEVNKFDNFQKKFPTKLIPQVMLREEIKTKSGALDLYLNIEATTKIFPHLMRCIPSQQISVLLGTTQLVGMECPGKHSVFFELSLFASETNNSNNLKYEVTKFQSLFGLVFMNVIGPDMSGVIKAFIRPTSQKQDSYLKLKELVNTKEFSKQRALIIGGSRGLGEVTGKLLAAGGAKIMITYNQGAQDARRIVYQIISNGGDAECLHLDVLSNDENFLHKSFNNWRGTHLYYFATPFIPLGINKIFSASFTTVLFCPFKGISILIL